MSKTATVDIYLDIPKGTPVEDVAGILTEAAADVLTFRVTVSEDGREDVVILEPSVEVAVIGVLIVPLGGGGYIHARGARGDTRWWSGSPPEFRLVMQEPAYRNGRVEVNYAVEQP